MQLKITHLKSKLAGIISLSFIVIILMSNASGTALSGNGGRTGASFDLGTCGSAGCHTGGTSPSTTTVQLLAGGSSGSPVTSYIPGASYTLKVKVASAGITSLGYFYGFQAVCIQSSTMNDINNWGTLPASVHATTWSSRTYVEQSATLHSTTTPFVFIPWTAPIAGTGSVIFNAGGCVVNNNTLVTGDNPSNTSITITENTTGCSPAVVSATPTTESCYGYSDGAVDLTITSAGTGITGYSWTGPAGYTAATQNISGLAPGTYTVVVTTLGGCYDTVTSVVNGPAALTDSIVCNAPVCPGADVNFSNITGGGTPTYSYSWTGPAGFTSFLPSPVVYGFTAADTGMYYVTVTDLLSCSMIASVDVSILTAPVVNLGPDTALCPGSSTVTLGQTLPGDTYLWNTSASTATINATDTGTYYVTVTNGSGCNGTDTIHVGNNCSLVTSEIPQIQLLSLSPNPASELVTIQYGVPFQIAKAAIYDQMGRKVYEQETRSATKQTIDISQLAPGVYAVQITADGIEATRKLVISK